jgi:hypothetical protein
MSTLTLTSHPPTATALRDGRCCCRPCLPPRRRSTPTSHPSATTPSHNPLCPCLPPRRRSTSRVDVDVASYHRRRHAQSLLLASSPSVSPPPFDVARPRCILPPPPPRAIFVVVVVPDPVPVPAALSLSPSLSSSPPPDDVDVASYHRHCHAQSSSSLPSSPPPVNVARRASTLTSHPTAATIMALAVGICAVFGIIVSILKSNTCNW